MRTVLRLVLRALAVSLIVGFAVHSTSAQTYQHINECTANLTLQTTAMQDDAPDVMVSSTRWFLTNCRDLLRGPDDEAGMLSQLALGLIRQGNPADAIPISNRCLAIKPDAAYCFVDLGEALLALEKIEDAKRAYQKAISIGGYDNVSAAAIMVAHKRLADLQAAESEVTPSNTGTPHAPTPTRFGTGFLVTTYGDILTNNHVVAGCKSLSTGKGEALAVLSQNESSDLALLQPASQNERKYSVWEQRLIDALRQFSIEDSTRNAVWSLCHARGESKAEFTASLNNLKLTEGMKQTVLDIWSMRDSRSWNPSQSAVAVAVFRSAPYPQLGDSVVAFGFPLPGVLAASGNLSTGIISATSGLGNDPRFIQISAPLQPGNSGGPLFDSSGHVIGVVVAKLDAVKIAEMTGDIPQNVNFAIQWSKVRKFLDRAGVPYQTEPSRIAMSRRSIADIAQRVSITIECTE